MGPILEEVVFVGGATIHLWLTEPGAPPVRATDDVDVICEVSTRAEYYSLGARLRERGLAEARDEPVICRWRSAEPRLVLDVMPTNPDILGFSNPWYERAISSSEPIVLDSGARIQATPPAPLVATKLCAWKGRGQGDLLRSLDVHDVLTLANGRPELVAEVRAAPTDLRSYVRAEIFELTAERYFDYALESATAGYGFLSAQRAEVLRERRRARDRLTPLPRGAIRGSILSRSGPI